MDLRGERKIRWRCLVEIGRSETKHEALSEATNRETTGFMLRKRWIHT